MVLPRQVRCSWNTLKPTSHVVKKHRPLSWHIELGELDPLDYSHCYGVPGTFCCPCTSTGMCAFVSSWMPRCFAIDQGSKRHALKSPKRLLFLKSVVFSALVENVTLDCGSQNGLGRGKESELRSAKPPKFHFPDHNAMKASVGRASTEADLAIFRLQTFPKRRLHEMSMRNVLRKKGRAGFPLKPSFFAKCRRRGSLSSKVKAP